MITVITPFSRKENKELLLNHLHGKCNWIILQATTDPVIEFPEWVTIKRYELSGTTHISNRLINAFIAEGLEPDTQYMILNDDDFTEEGFFEKIPDEDIVYVSMKRRDHNIRHFVFDVWERGLGHFEDGEDVFYAKPDNLRIANFGGEQFIIKGKILQNYRYGLSNVGDGKMILQMLDEGHQVSIVPEAFVYFNYLEDGRWKGFRRKPLALFVGDLFCAGNINMGKSEWEGNLWASLESTGLVGVARFHLDKYYYHTGERGDTALLEAIERIKPDFVILVIYKEPGIDPTVISLPTIAAITVPIISIWGDLEAEEQQALAKGLQPFLSKTIATASKSVADRFGYTYLHVPKDPRIFNNPNKERDLDIVFSGSYGYGREERQESILHLLNHGIKLIHGGSEGGDHFTTEEYADRYKRAKLALSFSVARGMNVVNARPFEAMLCGAMLLEQESLELAKLYTPFVDYVPWTDKEDLLKKVQYYLEHDDERQKIADAGCKKTHELYSAKTFWEKVLPL